jgi:hypothetical protein
VQYSQYNCHIKYLYTILGCKNSGKYRKCMAGFDGRAREDVIKVNEEV